MKELKRFLKQHPILAIVSPAALSLVQFVAELYSITNAGTIDIAQFRELVASASGLETLVLAGLMWLLRD